MPEPPPLANRVLAGRYRLVHPLARGAIAEVWEGHDQVLARSVAIKVLHLHLADDNDFVERFRREAVAAARLVHPGIVATYDTGADDGAVFIVMELVRGRTLRQTLVESGPLPVAVAVTIAAQVADALDHGHRAGMVHRDVRPANIVVVDHDGTTTATSAKVADFGIARIDHDGTKTPYLSPEQVAGATADSRSDCYALGAILYEMLWGRPPVLGDTDPVLARSVVRTGLTTIPAPLEGIVTTALTREPDGRYQSLGDLREALLALDLEGVELLRVEPARVEPAGVEPDDQETTGEMDALMDGLRSFTPPVGTPVVARPPERRPGPLIGVATLTIVALVIVVLLVNGGNGGGNGTVGGLRPGPVGSDVAIASARSFDPLGDGTENEERAALAVDGKPATAWNTQTYDSRPFGGLKSGVGLVIQLTGRTELRGLEIRSSSQGWAAEVYVAAEVRATLADWGRRVATSEAITGDISFDLGLQEGGAVLVWITDTGDARRVEISEVVVRA